jgi:hypothetical protein
VAASAAVVMKLRRVTMANLLDDVRKGKEGANPAPIKVR